MNKIYSLVMLTFILSSCATTVQYVGQTFSPTKNITVFVTKESIKQPYEIIGKGYVNEPIGVIANAETVQQQAVLLARKKGADAVLITDHYLITGAFGMVQTDSAARAGLSGVRASREPQFDIYFLKFR